MVQMVEAKKCVLVILEEGVPALICLCLSNAPSSSPAFEVMDVYNYRRALRLPEAYQTKTVLKRKRLQYGVQIHPMTNPLRDLLDRLVYVGRTSFNITVSSGHVFMSGGFEAIILGIFYFRMYRPLINHLKLLSMQGIDIFRAHS
jgi:hypothetical protein